LPSNLSSLLFTPSSSPVCAGVPYPRLCVGMGAATGLGIICPFSSSRGTMCRFR
jgi:hypothetical protein